MKKFKHLHIVLSNKPENPECILLSHVGKNLMVLQIPLLSKLSAVARKHYIIDEDIDMKQAAQILEDIDS